MAVGKIILTLSVVLAFISLANCYTPITPPYLYKNDTYKNMPIDHFAFTDNRTFNMRFLWNDTWYKSGGPIFFYCGNEGDITTFAANTGFMWDIAPMFNAVIVFAEHRFYGETKPFGEKSYIELSNLGYLSTEQALADYAVFLRWFKHDFYKQASDSQVIAFGGSYGGMLAAWIRMKYPHIVTGSLASSAPILQFTGVTECSAYSDIVTRTFNNSGENCAECIKKSWGVIRKQSKTDLQNIFHICPNQTTDLTNDEYANNIVDWLSGIFETLAEVDYPVPANFLNPLPGYPVKLACTYLTNTSASDKDLLNGIYQAASVFLNYTGNLACYTFNDVNSALDGGAIGWDFQSCTEMVMPMCNSNSSMFEPSPWNFAQFSEGCQRTWHVTPRENWAVTEYGADHIEAASNIIFSNGNLDPWSGGGVVSPIPGARNIEVYYIMNSAHHYDLRGGDPGDTEEIQQARTNEINVIRGWLGISNGGSIKSSAFCFLSVIIISLRLFFF